MKNQTLFDKYCDGIHWENHPTIYANTFVNFLREAYSKETLSKNFTIIDLGCGNGRDVNYFNQCGMPAFGLDDNSETITIAKENYPGLNFYRGDIQLLVDFDNSQQAYYCINVMHYVDMPKVIGEIHRALKLGGYAFIHFNLLIIDQNFEIDYHQKKSDVYELIKKFIIVEEKIFLREDKVPMPHIHHIMQVILKK